MRKFILIFCLTLIPLIVYSQSKDQKISLALNGQYSTGDFKTYGGGVDLISGQVSDSGLKPKILLGFFYEAGHEVENDYGIDLETNVEVLGLRFGFGIGNTIIYGLYADYGVEVEASTNLVSVSADDSEGDLGGGIRVLFGEQKRGFVGAEYSKSRELTISLGFNLFK